jgi:2-keto-4-pentenoate hydratase
LINTTTEEHLHAISTDADEVATKLIAARAAGASLAGFPGTIPASLFDAYCVQDLAISRIADTVGGWKVGRIFPPQSDQYGSDRLVGPIFNRAIQTATSANIAVGKVFVGGFGAAEAELIFMLGENINIKQTEFSLDDAAKLVNSVHIGIEMASSPLATINDLGPPVIISDFGNNNGLIIGSEIKNWQDSDCANWPVKVLIDGNEVGVGSASSFPDGPIGSVRFLLELMAKRGISLPAGTWVSTGAISGVHPVNVGQHVEARFGDERSITCNIAAMNGGDCD